MLYSSPTLTDLSELRAQVAASDTAWYAHSYFDPPSLAEFPSQLSLTD